MKLLQKAGRLITAGILLVQMSGITTILSSSVARATTQQRPDLMVTKTNDVNGTVVIGNTFKWVLTVQNIGNASATFDNKDILVDDLPTGLVADASDITVTPIGAITGSVDCDVDNDTLTCDDNSGNPIVVIPAGAGFIVAITAVPTATGSFTNPRSGNGKICRVDPDNEISESNENNNDCTPNSVTVTATPSTPNPPMGTSCGLDVALILDNSGSIDATELASMKSAMTSFTGAFAGTPTQFSVTKFADTGSVVQTFTSNITAVNTAINAIPQNGGATNWEDGLLKAKSTFDPRPSVPNLVIFASDGNPNRVDNGTTAGEAQAVNEAKLVANSIKSSPISAHIIALGIGTDLNTSNMEAISGPGDVITSNFSTLAADLAKLAQTLCGGTITINKLIDGDGNPNTNDTTPAEGWNFSVNTPVTSTATTGANGQTTAIKVDAGTYTVSETQKPGYKLLSAVCKKGETVLGQANLAQNNLSNLVIGQTDIVSCTFVNTFNQGTITVQKTIVNDNGGSIDSPSMFKFKIGDGAWTSFEDDGSNTVTVDAGTYSVTEMNYPGYAATYTNCTNVVVTPGANVVCTITNDDIAPRVTINKVVQTGDADPDSFNLYVGKTNVLNGIANDTIWAGNYSVTEEQKEGYVLTGADGCIDKWGTYYIELSLDTDSTCTLYNNRKPILTLVKKVINDDGGNASVTDWTLSATPKKEGASTQSGPGGFAKKFVEANTSYILSETGDVNGYQSGKWECDKVQIGEGNSISLAYGDDVVCTITNDDIAPEIYVTKYIDGEQCNSYNFIASFGDEESDTDTTKEFSLTGSNSCDNGNTSYTSFKAIAGQVTIEEESSNNWYTQVFCGSNDSLIFATEGLGSVAEFDVALGQTVYCSFYNTEKATVTLTKYEDKNKNGQMDEGEPTLSGWNLQAILTPQTEGDVAPIVKSGTTGEDGSVTFDVLEEFLDFGQISLDASETQKDGWELSDITCTIKDPFVPFQDERLFTSELLPLLSNDEMVVDTTLQPGSVAECFIGNTKKPITEVLSDTITPTVLSDTGASTTPIFIASAVLFISLAFGIRRREEN